ncbi:MAG: protein kinase [Planctomycetota bacterium]|nr:protein kinase [Planctomycetota bacterium]
MAKTEPQDILFGKIALHNGFVTEEQLANALRVQHSSVSPRRLGEVLLEMGYISSEQLQLILRSQDMRLDTQDKRLKMRKRDVLFGAVAVRLGFASKGEINEAVRKQAQMREQGKEVSLGEILVESGVLTTSQVKTVLSYQRRSIMVCQGCNRRYNVVNPIPTRQTKCPECGSLLVEPEKLDSPKVDASIEEEIPPGTFSIGDYIILEEISRGGMGVVYKARKRGTNLIVALKMMLDEKESLKEEVARFENEAKAIATLNHPNIVSVSDLCCVEGKRFFCMEYIEGKTLASVIDEGGVSIKDALSIVRTVAEALDYAHSHKIFHRDIKPSNIMVEEKTGRIVLMDFGLAVRQEQTMRLTKTGFAVGTPLYMAPESAMGSNIREYDPRSDVYSLGCVLYELLTGRLPFVTDNPLELMVKKMNEEPPSPSVFNPLIPRAVEKIVLRCIARKKEERYPSARALADELALYQNKSWARHRRQDILMRIAKVGATIGLLTIIAYGVYITTTQFFTRLF